jgi:hypothetical protein
MNRTEAAPERPGDAFSIGSKMCTISSGITWLSMNVRIVAGRYGRLIS